MSMPVSVHHARDGSVLWWATADAPGPPAVVAPGVAAPVTVAVSPVRPGHAVTVEYRVNGGPVRQAVALPEPRAHDVHARRFRAVLPGHPGGLVEFMPVLRLASLPISAGLLESADPSRYQVSPGAVPPVRSGPPTQTGSAPAAQHRWAWATTFFGSLTVTLRKEVVGPTPDGLRINWHVTDGQFVGPGFAAVVLPGAADWMRIRQDGVGIVNVIACLETPGGVRIFASYGGVLDLGPDGYSRALRDQFDPLPPLVVAPTYVTASKELAWLNRAQCIGVGRVDMTALRVEFDAYLVRVGERAPDAEGLIRGADR